MRKYFNYNGYKTNETITRINFTLKILKDILDLKEAK